ncbi:hypothetical protein FO519_002253 [Halicephalobus sp. NKZ332]|nr:hypothetical protein FO519_002253 [Halicephalobus sp. NKZ332]
MYSKNYSVEEKLLEYKDQEGTLFEGFLAFPSGTETANRKLPGITVHPAFEGITEFEEDKARSLAKLGYVAFCVDIYGKGTRGKKKEEYFAILQPLRTERRAKIKPRLLAGIKALTDLSYVDKEKVACIGFCLGGTCCLDLARYNAPVKGVISYHGTLTPLEPTEHLPEEEKRPIKPSVTICHGDADSHIPMENAVSIMEEFRKREADFQFIHYANAQHGFTEPKHTGEIIPGVKYNEKAAKRSWSTTLAFLDEVLHGK